MFKQIFNLFITIKKADWENFFLQLAVFLYKGDKICHGHEGDRKIVQAFVILLNNV